MSGFRIVLVATGLGLLGGQVWAEAERPNIVVILADDMGYSDLGCYGSEISTPNLDRLAGKGLRFTQFYNAARCCPTRASLLTGLYPQQAGIGHMVWDLGAPSYRGDLSRQCLTIGEMMKLAGYRTAMVGKWHVTPVSDSKDNWPVQRGFEKYYGIIYSVRSYFDPPTLARDNQEIRAAAKGFYLTDAISTEAAARVEEMSKAKEPFFLYVAYTAPHWPLHALEKDIAKYRGRYRKGWDALRQERYRRQQTLGVVAKEWGFSARDPEVPAWEEAEHKEWQDERMAVYAAMIDRMDQGIGRILDKLKATGAEENTLVLFLADNGACAEDILASWKNQKFPEKTRDGRETRVGNDPSVAPGSDEVFQSYGRAWANASNTPFRLYKHWVHEGGISTPLIASWPRVIKASGMVRQKGHLIDILPTCLDAAGMKAPTSHRGQKLPTLEGKSLLPLLQGKSREEHEGLFWEHEGNRAVRAGSWKLVAVEGGPWELYNLAEDRAEQHNLAKKHPDRARQMELQYSRWADRVGVVPWDKLNHPKSGPK